LRQMVVSDQIPSMIFWGPPGSGKTSLARVIANHTQAEFIQLSATTSGVKEVRAVITEAEGRIKTDGRRTILFIDEIHRFSKSQQDTFLPHVEKGTIVLIGATTENPSFEVNSARLSRMRVLVVKPLHVDNVKVLLKQALADRERGLADWNITIDDQVLETLAQFSNGDARRALNTLELAAQIVTANSAGNGGEINPEVVQEALQQSHLIYDRTGEEHYNTISAFIKAMRASQPDAALYYLARMVEVGEDALFIARRMVVFASEDIGIAQPTALVVANEVFRACETIGYPECAINLAHGVTYLAQAKKDRSAYEAYARALDDVRQHGNLPIPMHIRNAPTKLMKELGYGKGYERYPDKDKSFLPEQLRNKKYLT
jgi:putative ATPase